MSRICWLASYPKSGNTWVRALLTNYRRPSEAPADINALDGGSRAVTREVLDEVLGVDTAPLRLDQLVRYRARAYAQIAADHDADPLVIKVHDAFTGPEGGDSPFDTPAACGAVYLVRSPLDVAVSYAHHRDQSLDDTIAVMGQADAMLDGTRAPGAPVPQLVSSWSHNVRSWLDQRMVPVLLVRYEDLVTDPALQLRRIVTFLGLPLDDTALARAIRHSSFAHLRAQEEAAGFAEKQPTAPSFFREGRVGAWRDVLSPAQVARLRADHGDIMARLGFIDGGAL